MSESPINSSSSIAKKRKISENNAEDSAAPSSSSQSVSSNILVLDNDCLEIIFSLLSLKAQLNFSRSNRKIECMFRNYAQRKYKHITEDFSYHLEASDLEYLLEQVNDHVISFESPIQRFFGDREQLGNDVFEKFFFNLSENLPCLRKLVLEAPDYNGEGLHVLEKLQNLEINCELDAKYLTDCCIKMKNLNFLKMGRCTKNLNSENFSTIVANCRNLETLDFHDNELLDNVAYERVCELSRLKHLIMTCPRFIEGLHPRPGFIEGLVRRTGTPLESLILYHSNLRKEQIEHICDITSLRELWVGSEDDDFSVEGFMKLKSLEYLHLDMEGITNKHLLELLLGCPRLRVLNVLYCLDVTSDFISLLNLSSKKLKETNREKISIYLDESSVDWEENSSFKLDNIQIINGALWEAPILIEKERNIL
ncbi:uncharacterized protein [Drosophila bipectinata]|uniref:uncharacterized protein n=1 Tax=Drosophila bipectinata TaxID=42026 RepID=UPI0038B3A9C0